MPLLQVMVDCLHKLEGRVIAVVGIGHLDGIEKRWQALHSKVDRFE